MAFARSLGELNERQLRMIALKDRKGVLTSEEATAKQIAKLEKELQSQVIGLLRRCGINPIVNRFGKKTTTNKGCPDTLFAVCWKQDDWSTGTIVKRSGTVACAWEFKVPPNDLTKDQLRLRVEMT